MIWNKSCRNGGHRGQNYPESLKEEGFTAGYKASGSVFLTGCFIRYMKRYRRIRNALKEVAVTGESCRFAGR